MRKLILAAVVFVLMAVLADRWFFQPYRDFNEQRKTQMVPASAPGFDVGWPKSKG